MSSLQAQDGNVNTASGIARTDTEFAHLAYDLLDYEAKAVIDISRDVFPKYSHRTFENLEQAGKILSELEDEIKTRLAAIGILATVDGLPLLEGMPPIVDIMGHTQDHSIYKYGMDHEQKTYEVQKATARDEGYHKQKK